MYRRNPGQLEFENFDLPFGGSLSVENRWVRLSSHLPWEEIECNYSKNFSTAMGAPAKSVRMALGSLIIKEKLGLTDEETVEQIRENPYLQCFIGLRSFTDEAPFDASMMVHFRKRFSVEMLQELNERLASQQDDDDDGSGDEILEEEAIAEEPFSETPNSGKLLLDATCAPADIRYPTDLGLLNEVREKLEQIIDILHEPFRGEVEKPRTYRQVARRNYLRAAKSRKLSQKKRRKAIRQQLGYVERDFKAVDKLLEMGAFLHLLSAQQYHNLLVVSELYRQQREMFDECSNRIDDRIVSIHQPHVRPIVRGKAGKPTEFGAKLSASLVNGFVFLDKLSWDNFNESQDLISQVESYRTRHGCYPESVHVDQIYRTRANRKWCGERGIRLSGPPLGRPPTSVSAEQKAQAHEDQVIRNSIEGKFGQGKRKFSLGRIMAKLKNTSETAIGIIFLVMNLERCIQFLFFLHFEPVFRALLLRFKRCWCNHAAYFRRHSIRDVPQGQAEFPRSVLCDTFLAGA